MKRILRQLVIVAVVVIGGATVARFVRSYLQSAPEPFRPPETLPRQGPADSRPTSGSSREREPKANPPPTSAAAPTAAAAPSVRSIELDDPEPVSPEEIPAMTQRIDAPAGAKGGAGKAAAAKPPREPRVRWELIVSDGSEASLEPLPAPERGMRVKIDKLGEGPAWQVQVGRQQLTLTPAKEYIVSFRARAASPRPMTVAVTETAAHFRDLGLVQTVDLAADWRPFRFEFEAAPFAKNAGLHFDLGTSPAQVEIADVVVRSKRWSLKVQPPAAARLEESSEKPGEMRVSIEKADAKDPWRIQLINAGLPIHSGENYAVQFRARADEPRTAICALSGAVDPYPPMGLFKEFSLTKEWQPYRFEFTAEGSAPVSRLYFDLAGSPAAVQLADFAIRSTAWSLRVQPPCKAELVDVPGDPGRLRVEIQQSKADEAWRVQLSHPGLELTKGTRYLVRFRAKAERPRTAFCAVAQSKEPFQNLGLYAELKLSENWVDHRMPFESPTNEKNARLYFDLGGATAPVEFSDVVLEVETPVKPMP